MTWIAVFVIEDQPPLLLPVFDDLFVAVLHIRQFLLQHGRNKVQRNPVFIFVIPSAETVFRYGESSLAAESARVAHGQFVNIPKCADTPSNEEGFVSI